MWHVGRYGGCNHVCNISWLSVKVCGCSESPIDLRCRPYNTTLLFHTVTRSTLRVTVWNSKVLVLCLKILIFKQSTSTRNAYRCKVFTRTSSRYKNLSAMGRLRKSGVPAFHFGTPLISPKLIELESWNLVRWLMCRRTPSTSSSADAKKTRNPSCLSVVSFNSATRRVVFYC